MEGSELDRISREELEALRDREQGYALALDLVQAISQARDFDAAMREMLRLVAERAGWRVGEMWLPAPDRAELRMSPIRFVLHASPEIAEFVDASEHVAFSAGDGLPGRAFHTREVEWVHDLAALPPSHFRRGPQAAAAGLHAALAVPIVHRGEVVAVLIFFSDRGRSEDPRLIEVLSIAIAQVGLLLRQKQAQDEVARLSREVRDLSTPVLRLWEGVLAAPLVGSLDEARLDQLAERVHEAIVRTRSEVAIIDITGVPDVDTATAGHILDLARSAKLLGARVIVTGIRPAIAHTLVRLNVDTSAVTTRASLAQGLATALEHLGVTRPG